ncbi:MAG TPA: glutamyl-tRNA reductase [Streptosporangiaceae bacterium]
MTLLVVGLSHKSAPVGTLERAALAGDDLDKLRRDVFGAQHVGGAFIVSTCNRVEIYAGVDKFHGALSAISDLLARHSGIALTDLTQHLYVHYEDRAVQHLLDVTCGLDSMVVGESQILGQVRQALGVARAQETLGRELAGLGALALRTGKRAHAETGIDRAGANLVSVGIGLAAARLPGDRWPAGDAPLGGRRVLVVGAGSMSALAATTASRMGAAAIVVANRTPGNAERLAAALGGIPAGLAELPEAVQAADLVISCTGATGVVITEATLARVMARRGGAPLVLLDLALPRDVEPGAAALAGISLIDLDAIGAAAGPGPGTVGQAGVTSQDVAAVRAIVAEEFAAWASAARAASVTPTVVALRAKAAQVVDAELARLSGRLSGLDDRALGEISHTVRRVVDKLLHAPTVRMKELASGPGGDGYAAALRVLFDLDPKAIEAVTRADVDVEREAPE